MSERTRGVYNEVWETQVTVVQQERYDAGPFDFGAIYEDGTLDNVIHSLMAIRDSIPEEYRADARCEIGSESGSESGYECSHYASIEVRYYRPELPEETSRRLATEREMAEAEIAKARAQYEMLKAKFGP